MTSPALTSVRLRENAMALTTERVWHHVDDRLDARVWDYIRIRISLDQRIANPVQLHVRRFFDNE